MTLAGFSGNVWNPGGQRVADLLGLCSRPVMDIRDSYDTPVLSAGAAGPAPLNDERPARASDQ